MSCIDVFTSKLIILKKFAMVSYIVGIPYVVKQYIDIAFLFDNPTCNTPYTVRTREHDDPNWFPDLVNMNAFPQIFFEKCLESSSRGLDGCGHL